MEVHIMSGSEGDEHSESFRSAVESAADCEDEEEIGDDVDDGEADDLEYLTMDLVSALPPESWQHLLGLLRRREDRALDAARRNRELQAEVRRLRKQVAVAAPPPGEARPAASVACEQTTSIDGAWGAEIADLQRRAAHLAAERRGEARAPGADGDALGEDIREAARETLSFLRRTDEAGAADALPRLLSTLKQWLSWASNKELGPRGAASLLAQVPEETLQAAFASSAARVEELAGLPSRMAELPEVVPYALGVLAALPDNPHVQRVALACIALGAFSPAGRRALVAKACEGIVLVQAVSGRRRHHPEIQAWALAILGACAPDLPQDAEGARVAFICVASVAWAFRTFRGAPWVLECAACSIAALLGVFPVRVRAVVMAKGLDAVLQQVADLPLPNRESKTFEIEIVKTGGAIGLDVVGLVGGGLRVKRVAQGLVHEWNEEHADRALQAGDLIVEVNGVSNASPGSPSGKSHVPMLQAIKDGVELRILIFREGSDPAAIAADTSLRRRLAEALAALDRASQLAGAAPGSTVGSQP